MYPADLYMDSQSVLLMTGTDTSWRILGSGPSEKGRQRDENSERERQ